MNASPAANENQEVHHRTPVVMPASAGQKDFHCLIGPHAPTALGQFLDPAFLSTYEHPRLGNFSCHLAYWYWSITGAKHDELREMGREDIMSKAAGLRFVYGAAGVQAASLREGILIQLQNHPDMMKEFFSMRHTFSFPTDVVTVAQYSFAGLMPEFNWTNPIPTYLEVLNWLSRTPIWKNWRPRTA